MRRGLRQVGLVLVLLALTACSGVSREVADIGAGLDRCDTPAACGAAWARAVAMGPERCAADSGGGVRLKAVRVGIEAVAEFPEPQAAFLEAAGVDSVGMLTSLDAALQVLGDVPDAADAAVVLRALREPVCANVEALEPIESGDGPFASTARLVRMTALGQLVSAAEPDKADVIAAGARLVVGCTLSDRAQPDVVLVEARNRFYDLVTACPDAAVGGALGRSCDAARAAMREKGLPLPLPDVASGDFVGAVVPSGHGTGLRLTPSWVLVLSAGRLSVLDQKVLPPGVRAAGETQIGELIDLRRPHRVDDVRHAIAETLKTRKPVPLDERVAVVALAVDQSAVFSDLAEVLEALMAETDAHPVVAVLPPGYRSLMWIPLNYRMAFRTLMDPVGQLRRFPSGPNALDLAMTPFSLVLKGRPEQTAEFGRGSDVEGVRKVDLRDAYRLVADRVNEGAEPFARMSVAAAVPAGILIPLLDAVANRFQSEALASAGAFSNARTLLGRMGEPQLLVQAVVIRPEGAPAE